MTRLLVAPEGSRRGPTADVMLRLEPPVPGRLHQFRPPAEGPELPPLSQKPAVVDGQTAELLAAISRVRFATAALREARADLLRLMRKYP